MNILKPILSAFVIGGILSVVGQFFIVIFASILGMSSPLVGPLALVALGLVGGILFIAGIYQKLEKIGGYGAILPFSGLAAAVAGLFVGAKAEKGSSYDGLKASLSLIVYVIGIGTILSVIVGIVAFYTV